MSRAAAQRPARAAWALRARWQNAEGYLQVARDYPTVGFRAEPGEVPVAEPAALRARLLELGPRSSLLREAELYCTPCGAWHRLATLCATAAPPAPAAGDEPAPAPQRAPVLPRRPPRRPAEPSLAAAAPRPAAPRPAPRSRALQRPTPPRWSTLLEEAYATIYGLLALLGNQDRRRRRPSGRVPYGAQVIWATAKGRYAGPCLLGTVLAYVPPGTAPTEVWPDEEEQPPRLGDWSRWRSAYRPSRRRTHASYLVRVTEPGPPPKSFYYAVRAAHIEAVWTGQESL